jgi:hypothetical protein
MKRILPLGLLTSLLLLQGQEPVLQMEQVMTSQELQQTGVSTLSSQQRGRTQPLARQLHTSCIFNRSSCKTTNIHHCPAESARIKLLSRN